MKRETSELLMKKEISELLRDLKILIDSSEKDFSNKQYWAYEKFLDEYNTILSNLQQFSIANDLKQIQKVHASMRVGIGPGVTQYEIAKHREIVNESKKLLHRVEGYFGPEIKKLDTVQTLELIFSKFHSVARQLRERYDHRATLDIEDEYDVQDLLHSLLKIYFQDIRPEETTPSYAGGSRRMDFLLKSEKVVIEVKKTRKRLSAKEVGEELLVDIAAYSEHPDCNTLICFVYDPEGIICNPVGLETDLAKQSSEKLKVIVQIYPK